jgi:hypothetical protein
MERDVSERGPRRSVLCAEVSSLLRRERRLLESLAEARDRHRSRSAHPTARVRPPDHTRLDEILAELRWVELERAVVVQALGGALGLDHAPSLAELAGVVGPPWTDVLAEHRDALRDVVARIDAIDEPDDPFVELPSTLVDLRLQQVLHPPMRRAFGRYVRPSLLEFIGACA